MAGFVPGLLPTNRSQEKEFAQAYEDVLERYKGKQKNGSLLQLWPNMNSFVVVFLYYSVGNLEI